MLFCSVNPSLETVRPSDRKTVEGRRPSLHQTPPSKNLPIQEEEEEEEEEVASKGEEGEGAIRKQGFMKHVLFT